MEKKTFYLTTAIPYVNAAPHLGHVLEFVQTDVLARYQRSCGKDVALVTGADENSLKNVHAAEKRGISTQALCDTNSAIFRATAERVGLSFTAFMRTSNKKMHWPGVERIWKLCDKSGDIYKKKYRGLYCVGCEAFYEEDELNGGLCPEHRMAPEPIEEENYFFRLSRYQEKLEKLVESDELKIIPESRKNEVLSFIRSGLKDFSISRSVKRAKGWGVPVPNDPEQIQYVWFDALSTYITGIGYGTDEKTFNKYWPADMHVIGKGILRFHAVYWPAILLSAGLHLPKAIFVHGYITVEGQKMSKSLGNIIDPAYIAEKYGVDTLRYCLMSEVPTFEDGDFSEKGLIEMNNNELLANLGNLVNRTMVFIERYFGSEIPDGKPDDADREFLEGQEKLAKEITGELENVRIKDALHKVMAYSKNANRYFQDNKPWESVKTDKARAGTVLAVLVNQIRDLAIMMEPYLPATSTGIFKQLALEPAQWKDIGRPLKAGHKVGRPQVLFRKLEPAEMDTMKGRFSGKKAEEGISFADLDLEVGEILSVERHPDADKLYVERIRMGGGEIQVVSGLALYYKPEDLIGKKVAIVKNLMPAKLRGVDSQGMLLVAEKDGGLVEILECKDCRPGEKIMAEGVEGRPKKHITFKEFEKVEIAVKDYTVETGGKPLVAGKQGLKTHIIKDGKIC